MSSNRKRTRCDYADLDEQYSLKQFFNERASSSDDEKFVEFCGPFASKTIKTSCFGSPTKRKNLGFSNETRTCASVIPESDFESNCFDDIIMHSDCPKELSRQRYLPCKTSADLHLDLSTLQILEIADETLKEQINSCKLKVSFLPPMSRDKDYQIELQSKVKEAKKTLLK